MSRIRNVIVVALAALCAVPALLRAQTKPGEPVIRLRGRGDQTHDRFLKTLLASRDYLLITRDTVLGRGDTVKSKVVVIGATLRFDGAIHGDLIGVGANLFIRPNATITGETRNIAGGLYKSELSHLTGVIENSPNAQYEIVRTEGQIDIVGTEHPSILELNGIKGLGIPSYDRVNGLTLRAGAGIILPRVGTAEPVLRGWGSYYSQRGDFGGGGELAVRRGWTEVAAGFERTTVTNEEWIRSDVTNSLSMLLQGKDYRNYYSADRAFARIDRTVEKGIRETTWGLTGQVETATPLRAARPWSLFKPDTIRPNDYGADALGARRRPNGRLTSVIANVGSKWETDRFITDLNALAELGTTAFSGEQSFARYEIGGELAMAALRHHTLEFEWHFQGPLPGTDSLPYQRWSYVGGSGTLYTFPVAAFSGDRVAYVETMYTIPLPGALTLPFLGRPGLDLLHATAMAWSHDVKRSFEQNIGFRIGYKIAYLRVVTDPKHFSDDVKVTVGVTLPRKTYPWQAKVEETVK